MNLKIALVPLESIEHKDFEERPIKSNQNSSIREFIPKILGKWQV